MDRDLLDALWNSYDYDFPHMDRIDGRLRMKPLRGDPMREWLVIDKSRKNSVFATDEDNLPHGYIPRKAAEELLGRDLGGTAWFTKEEGEKMRAHPEWTEQEPPKRVSEDHMDNFTDGASRLQAFAVELAAKDQLRGGGTARKQPAEILALAWYRQVSADMENRLSHWGEEAQRQAAAAKLIAANYHGADQINDAVMFATGQKPMVHTMTITGKQVVSLGYSMTGAIPLWAHYVQVVRDLEAGGKLKIAVT
jgi:hypothetical protein